MSNLTILPNKPCSICLKAMVLWGNTLFCPRCQRANGSFKHHSQFTDWTQREINQEKENGNNRQTSEQGNNP